MLAANPTNRRFRNMSMKTWVVTNSRGEPLEPTVCPLAPCSGREISGRPPALPAVGDSCTRRCRTRTFDHRRLGRLQDRRSGMLGACKKNGLRAAQGHASPLAKEALERIGQLYGIEKEIRGRSQAERRDARHIRSRPLLEAMHIGLKATMSKLSTKSELAKTIYYAGTLDCAHGVRPQHPRRDGQQYPERAARGRGWPEELSVRKF